LNTAFLSNRFTEIINTAFEEVEPYLDEHQNRFPSEEFFEEIDKTLLLEWANNHSNVARQQVIDQFSLSGTHQVSLTVSDESAGAIQMNTVLIANGTTGVADNPYPWSGTYFNSVPVQLVAHANPGYVFSHWSGDYTGTNDTLIINSSTNYTVQANFTQLFEPGQLIHFWLFDDNLENDMPLTNIATTFSAPGLTGDLEYNSCLSGYPFDSSHPNWRKASMERRNRPTAINYRPEGNNDLSFEQSNMRGIQIKQQFEEAGLQNTMIFHFSTIGYNEIQLSFAAETDGAADSVQVSYWSGSAWVSHFTAELPEVYHRFDVDFSNVLISENNPDFKIRFTFIGADMTAQNGLRVHFNNIAIEGKLRLNIDESKPLNVHLVYPNPVDKSFHIGQSEVLKEINLYDALGRLIQSNLTLPYFIDGHTRGTYLVEMISHDGERFMQRVVFE
jgi:hypothetical protein